MKKAVCKNDTPLKCVVPPLPEPRIDIGCDGKPLSFKLLNEYLNVCLALEDFETAAKIRDCIDRRIADRTVF